MMRHLYIMFICFALFTVKVSAQQDTIKISHQAPIYSGYNAVCFANGCEYILSTTIPAGFTIKDLRFSFSYRALGTCNLNQAGWDVKYLGCRSPKNQGQFYTCAIGLPGLCQNTNKSLFNDLSACILPPQIAPYTMDIKLTFYRCVQPASGCTFSCMNGDGDITANVIGTQGTVGMEELMLSESMTIHPNPAGADLTLSSTGIAPGGEVLVSITNVVGQVVQQEKRKWNNAFNVNIESLTPGIYFVQVEGGQGRSVKRFVKE